MNPIAQAEASTRRLVYNLAHAVSVRFSCVNFLVALAMVKKGAPPSCLAGLCWQPYGEA